MNWVQFKDPRFYLCLIGTVVSCWFISQEVGGLNTPLLQIISSDSVDSLEYIQGKPQMSLSIYKSITQELNNMFHQKMVQLLIFLYN